MSVPQLAVGPGWKGDTCLKKIRDMGQEHSGTQNKAHTLSRHTAALQGSTPAYLHDGTELGLILHLLLSDAPLHTS